MVMTARTIHTRGERNIRLRFMTCLVNVFGTREILLTRLSFATKQAAVRLVRSGCVLQMFR
jgi:hypothetical protein